MCLSIFSQFLPNFFFGASCFPFLRARGTATARQQSLKDFALKGVEWPGWCCHRGRGGSARWRSTADAGARRGGHERIKQRSRWSKEMPRVRLQAWLVLLGAEWALYTCGAHCIFHKAPMPAPEAGRRVPYALTTPHIKLSLNLRGGARATTSGTGTGTGTGTGKGRRGRTKDTAQASAPSAADAVDAGRTPGTSGVGVDSAGNYSATTLAGSLASRVLVCVLPQGTQLANGLRHLCTCFILARHSNRALRIDPTQSMCASFFQRLLAGAAEPGQSSDGDAPAFVSSGGAGALSEGGRLGGGAGGGVEYTIQIPVVREPEWREHSELVAEDAAYDFVLRQHPWTNWHPLVEGVCNLTQLDSKPSIALNIRRRLT